MAKLTNQRRNMGKRIRNEAKLSNFEDETSYREGRM
jgi:hypothetical protein